MRDSIPALEHDVLDTSRRELTRRREAGGTRADDQDRKALLHVAGVNAEGGIGSTLGVRRRGIVEVDAISLAPASCHLPIAFVAIPIPLVDQAEAMH